MIRQISNRVNRLISPVEGVFVNPKKELGYPVFFIVGAPRSGTTLLYQLMTNKFDLAYLSNLHAKFFGAPSYIERFMPKAGSRGQSHDYQSYYGETKALRSPHECGAFWYRFFPRDVHRFNESGIDQAKLRRAVAAFVGAAGRPVIYKNVYNSLRIKPIAKAIPEARFIVIQRDLGSNIRSILKARKETEGGYQEWFSVPTHPPEQIASESPVKQVALQIEEIYRQIDEARACVGQEKFFDFKYEALCEHPREKMEQFSRWAAETGCLPSPKFEIPDYFPIQNRQLEPEIEREILETIEQSRDTNSHTI